MAGSSIKRTLSYKMETICWPMKVRPISTRLFIIPIKSLTRNTRRSASKILSLAEGTSSSRASTRIYRNRLVFTKPSTRNQSWFFCRRKSPPPGSGAASSPHWECSSQSGFPERSTTNTDLQSSIERPCNKTVPFSILFLIFSMQPGDKEEILLRLDSGSDEFSFGRSKENTYPQMASS